MSDVEKQITDTLARQVEIEVAKRQEAEWKLKEALERELNLNEKLAEAYNRIVLLRADNNALAALLYGGKDHNL